MKIFDYARGFERDAKNVIITKNCTKALTLLVLSSSLANANIAAQGIETISVKGQVNSLLMATDIDLQQASSPDLRSQLTQLPGVNINGNGQVSGVVQYRGLYSDRVRVGVDDVIIAGAGPNAMDSPLSHVIGNMSQRVTLYHAIAPVSAGAEALGGAIDISDISPVLSGSSKVEYSGAFGASTFSNNGQSAVALLNAVNERAYISLTADVQDGDNIDSGGGVNVANTYYNRNGLKLSGGFEEDAHKLSLFVNKRTTNKSGTPALAMDIEFVDALVVGVNYQYNINEQWRLNARIAGNNNEHDMNNFSQRSAPMPAMHRLNSVSSQGRSAAIGLTQEYSNWQNEYGIDVNMANHNSYITNPQVGSFFLDSFNEVNRDVYSAFGQWRQNVNKQDGWLNWQIGARATKVSASAQTIDSNMAMMNPNVMVLRDTFNASERSRDFSLLDAVFTSSYGINDRLKLQVSAGIKQKAPSYSQLYTWFPLGVSAGLADGRNYLGNLQLKKESAAKLDVGLRISGDDWVFMPNIFYTDVSDYIMGLTSTNMPANMIANMNNIEVPLIWQNQDATLTGIDFTYSHRLSQQWSLNATGQYVRAKQTTGEKQDLYRIAPMSVDINLIWQQNEYELSLLSRLVASQNKVASIQNERPSDGYALFNMQAKYTFSNGIELGLLAENLFDKEYADHLAGVNRVTNTEIATGAKLLGAGRNMGAFVSYQF